MTDQAQLRKTAERIIRHEDMTDDDAELLAGAWLTENPEDDGEPISEAWLRSVGLVDPPPDMEADRGYYGESVVSLLFVGQDGGRLRFGALYSDCHGESKWWACLIGGDGFDGSHDYLCPIPTRRAVRRLCAGLEIPLKEPT